LKKWEKREISIHLWTIIFCFVLRSNKYPNLCIKYKRSLQNWIGPSCIQASRPSVAESWHTHKYTHIRTHTYAHTHTRIRTHTGRKKAHTCAALLWAIITLQKLVMHMMWQKLLSLKNSWDVESSLHSMNSEV